MISYGHDIEAAWLLFQCAEIIHHDFWIRKFKKHANTVTKAAILGSVRKSLLKKNTGGRMLTQ